MSHQEARHNEGISDLEDRSVEITQQRLGEKAWELEGRKSIQELWRGIKCSHTHTTRSPAEGGRESRTGETWAALCQGISNINKIRHLTD